jgi:hypothetical protein
MKPNVCIKYFIEFLIPLFSLYLRFAAQAGSVRAFQIPYSPPLSIEENLCVFPADGGIFYLLITIPVAPDKKSIGKAHQGFRRLTPLHLDQNRSGRCRRIFAVFIAHLLCYSLDGSSSRRLIFAWFSLKQEFIQASHY